MDAEKLNDIARSLALCAVTGDRTELVKLASEYTKEAAGPMDYLANPYVRNALLGLGAGGLVGMLQPKRKLRNALTYGLVGGLGGLGLTPLLNQFGSTTAQPEQAGADSAQIKDLDAATKMVTNADPETRRLVGAAGGGLGGAALGYRSTVGAMRRLFGDPIQNLADVKTNAASARNWRGAARPVQVTSDTLAARNAVDPVRRAFQQGAQPAQRAALEAAIRRQAGGGSQATIRGATDVIQRGTLGGPSLGALSNAAAAAEANNAAVAGRPVQNTPSANQFRRAIREANRLAPTTRGQRVAGTAGGLGLGYLGSWLGSRLGEGSANWANSALRQKAFGQ